MYIDVDAIACPYRRAIARIELPVEELFPAKAIGRAQRFDRRRECHHRKLGHKVEPDDVRR